MRRAANLIVIVLLMLSSAVAAVFLSKAVLADTLAARPAEEVESGGGASSNQDRKLLEFPTEWVPFTAKVRVFSADMPRVDGRLYRASDGSTRLETGPPGEPPRTIDIKNVPASTHYLLLYSRTKAPSWTSAPMDVPEWGGLRPALRFADQAGLRKYQYKLSFRLGQEPSVFAADGFEVYHYVDVGGNVHLQAPALNMLDLVNQSITGRREEVFDIVLEEPDASLFRPPVGAVVAQQSQTRGMRLVPRGEHRNRH